MRNSCLDNIPYGCKPRVWAVPPLGVWRKHAHHFSGCFCFPAGCHHHKVANDHHHFPLFNCQGQMRTWSSGLTWAWEEPGPLQPSFNQLFYLREEELRALLGHGSPEGTGEWFPLGWPSSLKTWLELGSAWASWTLTGHFRDAPQAPGA